MGTCTITTLESPAVLFDDEDTGLSVLLQYKLGSDRQGTGSMKYAVPHLKWTGLRPGQLEELELPPQVRRGKALLGRAGYAAVGMLETRGIHSEL